MTIETKLFDDYKVVLKDGVVVAYGPNTDNYEPTLKEGESLEVWDKPPTEEQIDEGTIKPKPITKEELSAQIAALTKILSKI